MKTRRIAGQPSWEISSSRVSATLSQIGGQLAPVRFKLGDRVVEPYSIAPWSTASPSPDLPAMIQTLRGDFFCAPFGGNASSWKNEKHPPHGETANAEWKFESVEAEGNAHSLHVSLETGIRPGRVDKMIQLRDDHTAIYSRHVLSHMTGPMCLGHHAMLKFPETEGSGVISTSRIRFAQVYPGQFEDPAGAGYSSLQPGATFRRLDRVPTVFGKVTDLSRYPARRGFEDLVMVVHADREDFAWTAVAFPEQGYLWYALKDPRVLQSTVMWLSNGGRHYSPWNGRHTGVAGLEDVTSYFHEGLAASTAENSLSRQGIQTTVKLRRDRPFTVNYIMGVAEIPRTFRKVKTIRPAAGALSILSTSGDKIQTPIDLDFLYSRPQ